MTLTYAQIARTLAVMDPYHWTWGPARGPMPEGTSVLQRKLARLGAVARAEHAARGMGDIAHRLAAVDPARTFGLFPDVPPLEGRHPLVLAHGPSLADLLPTIRSYRHRLYLVAPLRTALRLGAEDVWPDVAVLADAAAVTSQASEAAWQAAPAGLRTRFEERVTLLTEPLAPAAIHRHFHRVRVFDEGLGWLPRSAELPFWGSAMLPSICLPLALGAPSVAIGGMNMTADHGRRYRTWRGEAVHLDPRQRVPHGLLEVLGGALPGRLVDVSPDAVSKRGVTPVRLRDYLDSPAAVAGRTAVAAPSMCAADVLRQTLKTAESFGTTIARMTEVASRVCQLSDTDAPSPELLRLVDQMERDWAVDPVYQSALSLVQPPFLRSLWELRSIGFVCHHPGTAARMKARLIGPEIAALGPAFDEWLRMFRHAAYAHSE